MRISFRSTHRGGRRAASQGGQGRAVSSTTRARPAVFAAFALSCARPTLGREHSLRSTPSTPRRKAARGVLAVLDRPADTRNGFPATRAPPARAKGTRRARRMILLDLPRLAEPAGSCTSASPSRMVFVAENSPAGQAAERGRLCLVVGFDYVKEIAGRGRPSVTRRGAGSAAGFLARGAGQTSR